MTDISRRSFLAATGGTLAAAWLTADLADLAAAGEHAAASGRFPPPAFEFLTEAEALDLDASASQIIPGGDDGPGAHEARVVYFIDRSLATWARDQRGVFRKGLREIGSRAKKHGAASFAALTEEQRHAVIESLESDNHEFFGALRGATIAGMFANPEYGGNHQKLGWRLIGFNDRFSWGPPFGWYDASER